MTVNEKNLRDTLTEVIGETETHQETTVKETGGDISKVSSGETEVGETTEREFVSGIDITDIPAEDRPRIKELLSKKASLLEKGYQPKFQKVAALDKALTELTSKGLSVEEAQVVLDKYIESKRNPQNLTQDQKRQIRKLDELINLSPPEQREALQQLRQITQEEASESPLVKELLNKVNELDKKLKYFEGKDIQLGLKDAEVELNSLKDKYGTIVEKYRENILAEKAKYPNAKVKDILKYVVPDEEYEQAIFDHRKPSNKSTKEKINAISSSGSGITSAQEQIDTKQSYKDLFRQLSKK